MSKRKICVVTGSRAEYGLLYWLLKGIQNDSELQLQVAVTGMHLSPEFGLTYRNILDDGFVIDAKIEMLLSSDTPVGISKSIGLGVMGFGDAFDQLKPDLVVLLGDRFEILAAAQAAMFAGIPIAHLHGGESTEGAVDEAIRHSLTKMSHLHFVSAEPYKQRVIQLGEDPERVFHVGALGIENIRRMKLLEKNELEESLDFRLREINFLVTYHPVTLLKEGSEKAFRACLQAFDQFPDVGIIFTKPNSDTNGRIIAQLIDQYVSEHSNRAYAATSLGQLRYLSALRHASVVIGNSSSGIIEAPYFRIPTVNIGMRQAGRLKSESIIDCDEETCEIVKAIHAALSDDFNKIISKSDLIYGDGYVSDKIISVLKDVDLTRLLVKRFHDLK